MRHTRSAAEIQDMVASLRHWQTRPTNHNGVHYTSGDFTVKKVVVRTKIGTKVRKWGLFWGSNQLGPVYDRACDAQLAAERWS